MLTYLPSNFWGVAFTCTGSALPKVLWRATYMNLPALLASFLYVYRESLSKVLGPLELNGESICGAAEILENGDEVYECFFSFNAAWRCTMSCRW